MPKPRALTPTQEQEAFDVFSRTPRRGALAAVARLYGLTHAGMRGVLARVERERKDSRESFTSEGVSS